MPSLEKLHQHFKGKPFAIIAIDIEEKRETVLKVVQSYSLNYVNVLDTDAAVSASYGVSSTPVKFLIDTKGNMVVASLGYKDWDSDEIKTLIQTLIDSGKK